MAKQVGKPVTPYYIPSKGAGQNVFPKTGKRNVLVPAVKKSRASRMFSKQVLGTLKGQFLLLACGCMLAALILSLVIAHEFQQASADLDTIANGSVPSVNAAQAIAQYSEDIDAKSADYLATASLVNTQRCAVVGPGTSSTDAGMQTVHDCDMKNIDAEIVLLNQQLFQAAHNVTFPGEQTAVERITTGVEEYSAQIAIMQHEFMLAKSLTDPHDEHLSKAYRAYQDASNVLHQKIQRTPPLEVDGTYQWDETNLPSCVLGSRVLSPNEWVSSGIETNVDCLNAINKAHLDAAYDNASGSLTWDVILAVLMCLVFCLLLSFTTWRMAHVTHRAINFGLSLAVLIGIIFSLSVVSSFVSFSGRHGAYGQIVQDDYNSVYYAAQMKRYATNANADESRWLAALFFQDSVGVTHWEADWRTSTLQVHTLMENAKHNQTWPEEEQPLQDMQQNWTAYSNIDGQIRSAADASNGIASPAHLAQAEVLSTGQSNSAFGLFTDAVDRLSQANAGHYTETVQSTQQSSNLSMVLSLILFVCTGLAAVAGIAYRLKDF